MNDHRLSSIVAAALLGPALGWAGMMLPPGTVTAQWSSPATGKQPVVEVISAASGKPVRELLKLPEQPTIVSGPFAGPDGSLWFSMSRGPELKCPDCMESTPVPDTCSSRVVRFDPSTGAERTVLTVPASQEIDGAVPSPDGSKVVFLAEGCTGFSDWHYVVSDLRTGRSAVIGAANAPCHGASYPSWAADGKSLVFTWSPSVLPEGAHDPTGEGGNGCLESRPGELAVVAADRSGPIAAAELRSAGPHCSYVAAAFDWAGIVAVKDCHDEGGVWLGTPALVQLSRSSRPLEEFALPPNPDGLTLSVAPGGHNVLVAEYEAAATGAPDIPTEWLIAFDGHALRTIVRDHTGVDSLQFAAWE